MSFLYDYGLFLAKTATFLIALLILFGFVFSLKNKNKGKKEGELLVEKINDRFDDMEHELQANILSKHDFKKWQKAQNKKHKAEEKNEDEHPNLFVLQFEGDVRASEVELIREEISAILTIAQPEDEVLVILESAGGMVHNYGLAASQLKRIRDKNIKLTVAIDRIAASGGYMMACVAQQILAAPFAILGSIGVIAQLPNFNKVLKKFDVDYEQISAGEYKRTLTLFGPTTDKARAKFQEEVDETHVLFKGFVKSHRDCLDIDRVATGEHWYGQQALDLKLCDKLQTSDDYLLSKRHEANIYLVSYVTKESLTDRVSAFISTQLTRLGIAATPAF